LSTVTVAPGYQRFVNVVASILIMCCSGSVYAWSIFVTPLREEFHLSSVQPQLVFGLIIASFTITMLFVGRIERKFGPRITAAIGAVLFCSGYLLASFSDGNIALIILGISILSGSGMGFGYVTVLSNLVRWFPDRKGLATGIAVAGFGSGALLLSWLVGPSLDSGFYILNIFRMIGIIYGILFLVAALFLSSPGLSSGERPATPVGFRALAVDRRFWVLFYTFFAGSFSGLMLIGHLKPLGMFYGIDENTSVTAVVLLSIGNALGRILWGQIHDKIGGKSSVAMALALLSLFIVMLLIGLRSDISFLTLALIIGLCFGANFVLYASDVSDIYGIDQLGIVYPRISLAYGIAGIAGPLVGGYLFDITGNYYLPIILSVFICLSGLTVYALAMKSRRSCGKSRGFFRSFFNSLKFSRSLK
jgi:OFA family oxalate/formate antiporter-like MFS transporter